MKNNVLISTQQLRNAIFSSLGYDDFNIIRSNKLYDRLVFDYGYYGNGLDIKRINGYLFHYNRICKLGNNISYINEDYMYRLNNNEIKDIIKIIKTYSHEIIY